MTNNASSSNFQKILENRLIKLVELAGIGNELKVTWEPSKSTSEYGRVVGNTIHIYCEDKDHALEVIEHEFVDWAVVQALRPYERLINLNRVIINSLMKSLEEEAYRSKEEVVESLVRMIGSQFAREGNGNAF